jgi:signal transduction histidine kinase/CHASE3 domain sensor protein
MPAAAGKKYCRNPMPVMHFHFKRILHVVLAAQMLPLLCGVLIVFALQFVIITTEHSTKNEEKARAALKSCAAAQKNLLRSAAAMALFTVSGLDSDLEGYYKARPELMKCRQQLQDMEAGFPNERPIIDELLKSVDEFSNSGDQLVALHRLGRAFSQQRLDELFAESQVTTRQWGQLSRDLHKAIAADLKLSPVSAESYITTLSRILLVGLAAVFLACLMAARILTSYIDRRLSVVRTNSARLADGSELLPALGGNDEIATLDKEFHSMAAAILEASKREKEILENASDIILTLDEALVIKSASAASVQLWSGDQKLDGASLAGFTSPENGGRLRRFFEHCKQTNEAGFIELPLHNDSLHGSQHLYASLSAQWSAENRLFSCVIHDITERKQAEDAVRESEQRLREMLEKMPAGMLLVNSEGCVIGSNETAAHLIFSDPALLPGEHIATLFGLQQPGDAQWLYDAAEKEQVILPFTHDSQTRHIEITVEKLTLGGADNFLLVMLDTTANQKLEVLRHQLIDGISTTIIEPLNGINAVLDRLSSAASQENNDKLGKYLSAAESESQRLLKLFSDLLDVERSNIQQLSINPREVEVYDLMERSLEAVRVTAEKKQIKLAVQPTQERLIADPDRLVQVLINLIFNALKFTPKGGYVRLEAERLPSDQLELRVLDSGCGIPAGMEEKIFEPFKQTRVSDALSKGGSGLGLFICKSIVEKHGGTIGARNHAAGAVFYLRLPLNQSEQVVRITAKSTG